MSHYDDLRDADYAREREIERKQVAKDGDIILKRIKLIRSGLGWLDRDIEKAIKDLESSVMHWMYTKGALKLNGE